MKQLSLKNRKQYMKQYMFNYYLKNKNKWKKRSPNYYYENKEIILKRQKGYREKARSKMLMAYSKGKMECMCCGEKEIKFLAIDHINGGGKKERKRYGATLYWKLKKENFPEGYQVLCHNCNLAKGFYGKCPHNNI